VSTQLDVVTFVPFIQLSMQHGIARELQPSTMEEYWRDGAIIVPSADSIFLVKKSEGAKNGKRIVKEQLYLVCMILPICHKNDYNKYFSVARMRFNEFWVVTYKLPNEEHFGKHPFDRPLEETYFGSKVTFEHDDIDPGLSKLHFPGYAGQVNGCMNCENCQHDDAAHPDPGKETEQYDKVNTFLEQMYLKAMRSMYPYPAVYETFPDVVQEKGFKWMMKARQGPVVVKKPKMVDDSDSDTDEDDVAFAVGNADGVKPLIDPSPDVGIGEADSHTECEDIHEDDEGNEPTKEDEADDESDEDAEDDE
jgi:hypothetical protein